MKPASYLHSVLAEALLAALPAGACLRSEQPIACAGSEPEPDLAVVKGRKEDFRRAHPTTAELVIEICVSSHDYDRSKLPAYANAGVKEVWLVLEPERQIEIHRLPIAGRYTERAIRGSGGAVASQIVPSFEVSLDALFG